MVRSERFPARGCRSNERATESGPACPYFRKLSSKALLYRCAVSSAGCYGQVTAVADRGVLGSVPADVVATVMVLQALEGLSDRDAAAQLKQNIAWKVACRLPLTDSGSIRRC
jgi:hypothetical protein